MPQPSVKTKQEIANVIHIEEHETPYKLHFHHHQQAHLHQSSVSMEHSGFKKASHEHLLNQMDACILNDLPTDEDTKQLLKQVKCYGEDASFSHSFSKTMHIMGVCDGHGYQGHLFAQFVAIHLLKACQRHYNTLETLVQEQQWAVLKKTIHDIHLNVDKRLRVYHGQRSYGGTTCSYVLITQHHQHQKAYIISANVGDSPIVVVDPNTQNVIHTSQPHTWDNEQEYQLYCTHCAKHNYTPATPVYNRFNCVGGNGYLPGPHGRYKPISLYNISSSGKVSVNKEHATYIVNEMKSLNCIGGLQSQGKMVNVDEHNNVVSVVDGYEHCNWGSTVLLPDGEGGCQTSRSFGDFEEKLHTHAIEQPSISVCEVSQSVCVLVMSDGVSDKIGYLHTFGTLCETMDNHAPAQQMLQHIMKHVLHEDKTHEYDLEHGKPVWDDISLCVGKIVLENNIQKDEFNDETEHIKPKKMKI